MKEEIEEYRKFIDANNNISTIQKDFLKEVSYWTIMKNEYIFIEKVVVDKYSDIISEESLMEQIEELEEFGYLNQYVKRNIYSIDGKKKWVTNIYYEILSMVGSCKPTVARILEETNN